MKWWLIDVKQLAVMWRSLNEITNRIIPKLFAISAPIKTATVSPFMTSLDNFLTMWGKFCSWIEDSQPTWFSELWRHRIGKHMENLTQFSQCAVIVRVSHGPKLCPVAAFLVATGSTAPFRNTFQRDVGGFYFNSWQPNEQTHERRGFAAATYEQYNVTISI